MNESRRNTFDENDFLSLPPSSLPSSYVSQPKQLSLSPEVFKAHQHTSRLINTVVQSFCWLEFHSELIQPMELMTNVINLIDFMRQQLIWMIWRNPLLAKGWAKNIARDRETSTQCQWGSVIGFWLIQSIEIWWMARIKSFLNSWCCSKIIPHPNDGYRVELFPTR